MSESHNGLQPAWMLGPFRVAFSLFPGLFPGFASVPPLSRLAGPTRGAGQVPLNHVRADVLGKLPGCSFFGWRPNFPANFGWLMAKTQRGEHHSSRGSPARVSRVAIVIAAFRALPCMCCPGQQHRGTAGGLATRPGRLFRACYCGSCCFPVERMEQAEQQAFSPGRPGLFRLFPLRSSAMEHVEHPGWRLDHRAAPSPLRA